MKRVFGKILAAMLVCAVLLSVAAFAAELPTYEAAADGTYSIGYTEGTNGNYYALLVVDGIYEEGAAPAITEETVLYIDQATADANGDVSFDGWIPKSGATETMLATVYLGGTGLDTPVLLGYLGTNSFIVAGTVTTDSGTTYEATVTLTDLEGTAYTATSDAGAYSVEVPEGTYTFNVNVKNHLSYTDNDFAVTQDVEGKDVSVIAGDLFVDDVVDFEDLKIIVSDYNASVDTGDITGDGVVDFDDLKFVVGNYNASAVSE